MGLPTKNKDGSTIKSAVVATARRPNNAMQRTRDKICLDGKSKVASR
jgi:hypothetical protein